MPHSGRPGSRVAAQRPAGKTDREPLGQRRQFGAVQATQQMVPGWTIRTVGDPDGHHQLRFGWEMGPEGRVVPGWTIRTVGDPDGHHQLRFGWEMGPEGEDPAPVAGFDVVALADDGRISRVFGFFDRMPSSRPTGSPGG